MRLIITRHGETEENKKRIVQGHMHGTLSSLGKKQAKKLAKRLEKEDIDIIYSSDLRRASDTAKEIVRYHPNVPLKFVKELRERNFGVFERNRFLDIDWSKQLNFGDEANQKPKGGESRKEVFQRMKKFLHKIIRKHKKENVLFVGHAGLGQALIAEILGKPDEYIMKPLDVRKLPVLRNTSVSIFDLYEDKKHKIHLLDDIGHLD